MKKINVNGNCIGCGACIAVDPEHFDFNDEGLSTAISNENLETDELKNAIASCPVNAIEITDGCNCDNDCNCGDECQCGDECHCGEGCACHKE